MSRAQRLAQRDRDLLATGGATRQGKGWLIGTLVLYRVAGGEAKHGVHVGGPGWLECLTWHPTSHSAMGTCNSGETGLGSRWGQQGVPGGWYCYDGEVGLSG